VRQAHRASGAQTQEGGTATIRGRSAKTGKFVKQSTVRRHPDTTVNESTKKRGSSGGGKK
jgi:hypothetical protein